MASSVEEKVEGLGGLMGLIGIVPTRARFVGEAVVSSLLSSITVGLTFGTMGAAGILPTGPLIPFLVGAWTGHTVGLFHYYRLSKNSALKIARNYPSILAHAMWTEHGVVVPPNVIAATAERCQSYHGKVDKEAALVVTTQSKANALYMDQWIQKGGYKMVGFAILAAQQCSGDVEEVQRYERDALIQSHQENFRITE